jgi:PCRF domain
MSEEAFTVDICAIIGGDESHYLVERLLGMFDAWASARGIVFELLDTTPAFGGGFKSAKFSLAGTDRASFAALHDGVITLIRIPPDDPNQRRHMSVAGVRSSTDPALPLPQEMGDWGEERRRFFYDPDRVIVDAQLGRLDIDPDDVFAGNFTKLVAPAAQN